MSPTTKSEVPNPGSDEARELGCKCPVWDNNHGIGGCYWGRDVWIYSGDCPLHKAEFAGNTSVDK